MDISIIIPTYRRPNDLLRLCESIYKQKKAPAKILIIIGPGDIESLETVTKWKDRLPGLKTMEAKKASMVHSLNLGLAESKGEIICLLDDDVWLPPDWSSKIIKEYEENQYLGGFGGRDILQEKNPKLSNPPLASKVGTFNWNGSLTGNHHCGVKISPATVDVLKGCNLSFRRSAFKKMQIEPALESSGAETCSEIDICQQIQLAGFQIIYDNENYVLHYVSERLAFDKRFDLYSPAWTARVYNYSLVIAKYRPLLANILFMLRNFFVGSRVTPGMAWSILLLKKYNIKVLKLPWHYAYTSYRGISYGYRLRNTLARANN